MVQISFLGICSVKAQCPQKVRPVSNYDIEKPDPEYQHEHHSHPVECPYLSREHHRGDLTGSSTVAARMKRMAIHKGFLVKKTTAIDPTKRLIPITLNSLIFRDFRLCSNSSLNCSGTFSSIHSLVPTFIQSLPYCCFIERMLAQATKAMIDPPTIRATNRSVGRSRG